MLRINLFEIIRTGSSNGFELGMTLNRFAGLCAPPDSWTFPWVQNFGGSIQYGDLQFIVETTAGNVTLTSLGLKMWKGYTSQDGCDHIVPVPKLKSSRKITLKSGGIAPGMDVDQVLQLLQKENLNYKILDRDVSDLESNYLLVGERGVFSFHRNNDNSLFLMSVSVSIRNSAVWNILFEK